MAETSADVGLDVVVSPARQVCGGRNRRVLIVALARKLLVGLWKFTTTGLVPEGATISAA